MEKAKDRWQLPKVLEECKAEAKKRGLWNMFLPADRETGDTHGTMGLSNLEYAPICEVLGRSAIASEAVNCSAPDTGNMEVFARYGSKEHKKKWLKPLLNGEIRSCFAMTEPAVPRPTRATSSAASRPTATTTSSTAASGGRRAWAIRAARSSS